MPDFSPDLVDGVARLASATARPIVLIDGGSGAGKSTFARALAGRLGAQLLHLEDIYPGWDGLEAASRQLHDGVLASSSPRWQAWDWERSVPSGIHELDPARPLVVEGSGSLSRANRALATFAVWLELDAVERKRRAIARDGERYAPHWDRWAAQELEFARRERPQDLADVVLDVSHRAVAELTLRNERARAREPRLWS